MLWDSSLGASYCFLVIDTAYLHKGNKIYTKTISRQKQLKHVAWVSLRWWEVNVHPFCGCIAFHVPKCCSAQWKCCHLVGGNYPTPLDVKQKCSIFIHPYSTDCTRNTLLYGWNMQTLRSYRFLVDNLYLFLTYLCFIHSYVIKSLFHSCPWASLDDLPPCNSIYLNTCARNCDLENNSSRASPCDPMCC